MKKSISLVLAIIMLFSVVNVSVLAASIATPKVTSANAIGGVQVNWNKVNGAVKYNVYRRNAGQTSFTQIGTTANTTFLDKNAKNGQYYCYTVRAFNSTGGYSAYIKANTSTRKYVATPKLTKLVNSTDGLTLSWNSVLSGASYRVYRRGAGSSTWTYLGTVNGTTYTDSKATNGKYWRYTVRAVSSGYYSGFDANGLYTMRLANPYSLKASHSRKGIDVTWSKINGATGYRVYRRGAGQTSWTYLGATTDNSFRDNNVKLNEYYRYTVRATRGNIYSYFYSSGVVIQYATAIKNHLPKTLIFNPSSDTTTKITINTDGSVKGTYRNPERGVTGPDYPKGLIICNDFIGKFTNIKQIDYSIYSLTLSSYTLTHQVGKEWFADGYGYYADEIYGLKKNAKFILYTPGTPIYEIPDKVLMSFPGDDFEGAKFFNYYCLYNADSECAFFEYN